MELSNRLTKQAYEQGRTVVLGSAAMMLQAYGMTWDELYITPSDLIYRNIFKRTAEIAKEYFSKLLTDFNQLT